MKPAKFKTLNRSHCFECQCKQKNYEWWDTRLETSSLETILPRGRAAVDIRAYPIKTAVIIVTGAKEEES